MSLRASSQYVDTHSQTEHLSTPCSTCGFSLWLPVLRTEMSEIGLYSDSRFPGRCIVSMSEHFDQLIDVPGYQLTTFMEDVQFAADAIKRATDCARVNIAILGNAERHVHAHVIPRFPQAEALPTKAPWEDPRPKAKLTIEVEDSLMEQIRSQLELLLRASVRPPQRLAPRRVMPIVPAAKEQTLFDLLSNGSGDLITH